MWLYVNEKFRHMTIKEKKLVTDLLLTQLGILVGHLERCPTRKHLSKRLSALDIYIQGHP